MNERLIRAIEQVAERGEAMAESPADDEQLGRFFLSGTDLEPEDCLSAAKETAIILIDSMAQGRIPTLRRLIMMAWTDGFLVGFMYARNMRD